MSLDADSGASEDRKLAEALRPALALARDTFGYHTAAEALRSPLFADVLSVAGTLDDLGALQLDALPSSGRLVESLGDAIGRVVDGQGPDAVDIYLRSVVEGSATLQSISKESQRGRWALRTIRTRIIDDLERQAGAHANLVAALALSELPPIVASTRVEQRLDDVLSAIAAERGTHDPVPKMARHLVKVRLGHLTHGPYLLTADAVAQVDKLRDRVTSGADDVGLVDLDKIVQRKMPGLSEFRDELVELLELSRVGTSLALRVTDTVRIKAAILEMGRPATKEEIARVSGVKLNVLTSRMAEVASIVRAGKTTWAIADWVDEPFRGITAMIVQRIREHDGATSMGMLLEEFPERFGVSIASVWRCLQEDQFEIVDGMVRLTGPDHPQELHRPDPTASPGAGRGV